VPKPLINPDACDEKQETLFKFFLRGMARDMKVANREVRDFFVQDQSVSGTAGDVAGLQQSGQPRCQRG
jgi:hypothetical protein